MIGHKNISVDGMVEVIFNRQFFQSLQKFLIVSIIYKNSLLGYSSIEDVKESIFK